MRDRAVVARRAHNPEVAGSSPAPATLKDLSRTTLERERCVRDDFFKSNNFPSSSK